MLHLPSNHPDFDLTFELLCSLPVEPSTAPFCDLCEDLGYDDYTYLREALNLLQSRGYTIRIIDVPTVRVPTIPAATLPALSAKEALRDARLYWNLTRANPPVLNAPLPPSRS